MNGEQGEFSCQQPCHAWYHHANHLRKTCRCLGRRRAHAAVHEAARRRSNCATVGGKTNESRGNNFRAIIVGKRERTAG